MKAGLCLGTVVAAVCVFCAEATAIASSGVEMLNYSMPGGDSGLRLAWRPDSTSQWQPLGYDFVKNDFGPWGSHKKMYAPRLFVNASDSLWTAVWKATPEGDVFALSTTDDFRVWSPQRYFASELDLPRDMRPLNPLRADSATVDGVRVGGYVQHVSRGFIDRLASFVASRAGRAALHAERAADDSLRFAGLDTVRMTLVPRPAEEKKISDKLIGIFFEDINYAADGGLYAELIQNRDFEYDPSDRRGDNNWNATTAWSTEGDGVFEIRTDDPIHYNNPHYASVRGNGKFALINSGFDFIPLRKGESYDFSMKARVPEKPLVVDVQLVDAVGNIVSSKKIKIRSKEWTDYSVSLKAKANVDDSRLRIVFAPGSEADLDMVSLFPARTFKGRRNGLRDDLARTLADMRPRFVRFPGGCVAHGDGIDNIYDWKGSIGPLEARKALRNLWGYHQTRGLGYYEYFLFCEDIGAEPLPVLSAGVPCQNSGDHARHSTCTLNTLGQQGGIPWEEMPAYVQDVLDLIEYANGDVTTEWGARRAADGHPDPFDMKYLGIGNEDMITEVFEPRFRMIYDAVRERYPEITVIGTVGPFYEGSDYEAGWELARRLDIPMVDEHYYVEPGWYVHNRDFYDSYPRGGTQVYLGEYASHIPGRKNTLETALSIALYLTDIERNADVVAMTSYAPLLAKKKHTQWKPDLIYFNNTEVFPTVDYEVQKIYGNNSGDSYIPAFANTDNSNPAVNTRIGTSVVRDSASGDYIVKLVNFLPVPVVATVNMEPLGVKADKCDGVILSGNPDDGDVRPEAISVSLHDLVLPPYSFLTFRVH